jgi:hypothetical protein
MEANYINASFEEDSFPQLRLFSRVEILFPFEVCFPFEIGAELEWRYGLMYYNDII